MGIYLSTRVSQCWEQYWSSPGSNTPQDTSCTATCLPSRKLYELDEPDTQDTAGEARTNSSVMYSYGPSHMAKQKQDDLLKHTYSSYVRIREDLPKTINDRERWQERVRDICASGTTWWWWWWSTQKGHSIKKGNLPTRVIQ